jgi:hypothetical protein
MLGSHCSKCHVDKIFFKDQQQSSTPDHSYFTTMDAQLMIRLQCTSHSPTQSYFTVQTTGLLFHLGSEANVHSPDALVRSAASPFGIYEGQSGYFLRTLLFSCQYHSINGPKTYFIHFNTNDTEQPSQLTGVSLLCSNAQRYYLTFSLFAHSLQKVTSYVEQGI